MSKFTNYFSKHVREKFTKFIELVEIERKEQDFIFKYKVLPFINLRVISKYSAKVTVDSIEYDLPCEYDNSNISVKLPIDFFNQSPDNLMIRLYSFNTPMTVKRSPGTEHLRTQHIVNEKLYNVKVKKDTHLSKRYMTLSFKDEPVQLNNLNIDRDGFKLSLDFDVSRRTQLFLSYPHKFIELPKEVINKNTIKMTDINTLTNGIGTFYIGNRQNVYPIESDTIHPLKLFTEYYLYNTFTDPKLKVEISEHVMPVRSMDVSEIEDNFVELKFTLLNSLVLVNPTINIYNPHLETNIEMEMTDDLRIKIPMEYLTDGYTRKKLNFINDGIIYQLDISGAFIRDDMKGDYVLGGEKLKTNFYRRKDNYLGFRVLRPRIRRRITEVKDFHLKGFVKGNAYFEKATNVIIFEDRYSKETFTAEVDTKFNYQIDVKQIIKLMSRDKTVIDVFIGMEGPDKEIIAREKLPFKKSNYKKDNFYDLKVIHEKNRDVYLLITTTPFNNLKIDTFTVPHALDQTIQRNPNVWLIGERSDTAQENGLQMFHYLKKHTDIEAYYVIDGDSKDYEKIKHEKNVLVFGSLRHYEVSLEAGVLLCTHDFENILPYKPAREFFNYQDTFKVFLQHGVLGRKPAEYHKRYYRDPFDIFIVSSDSEKYNIVMNQMGYKNNEVRVTGLARFDQLPLDQKGKDILVMPTWRDWINSDERFLNSEYYHRYKNFLESDRLHSILKEHNVRLNFYPHYRAQAYFNKEMIDTNEYVEFITLGERTVQDLLIDHALLITDYSSVSFDFTMMQKPVVYYHFDEEDFFNKGILRPVNETFLGDIAETEEVLISFIEENIEAGFKSNVNDTRGIIKYIDHNNCKRIYEVIIGSKSVWKIK